jgi:hypothetical protein
MLPAQNVMQSRTSRTDGRDRIDILLLRHILLEDVGLDGARQLVEVVAAPFRERDVHGQQDPCGGIDGEGGGDVFEVDAVEQFLHVGQRVDGDALAADLALAHRMVGVVTHQGGHVEVGGQSRLALLDQVLEALVGVLARPEAGDLAHGPQPAAVHGGIGAAGEGIAPGQADVGDGRVGRVEGRVDPFHRDVAEGEELRLALRLFFQECRDLVALPVVEFLARYPQAALCDASSSPNSFFSEETRSFRASV